MRAFLARGAIFAFVGSGKAAETLCFETIQRKQAFAFNRHGRLVADMEKTQPIRSFKGCPEAGARGQADGGGVVGCAQHTSFDMELEGKIQKAVEFKAEGNRCYKEKKFREAIGKYHRALLQLKGVHVGEGSNEDKLPAKSRAKLTEAHKDLIESTEIECYDNLTDRY